MATITYTKTLTATTCGGCGVHFALPDGMLKAKRSHGGDFYCPNGHVLNYRKTDADRLRDELAETKTRLLREREAREQADRRVSAAKGEVTKARKRAAAALCPCCNRSFVQLRRHLASKHPDYAAS